MNIFGSNPRPANPVTVRQDPAGAPAVDLNQLTAHPGLKAAAETVGVSLRKRGLSGMRGRVVVVIDHSGSMYGDYANGTVQALLTRTLGFGCQIDTDGTVEVIPFDSRVWPTQRVDTGSYPNAARGIWRPSEMGSTNLAAALKTVRDLADKTDEPIVCVVITDGEPDSCTDTTDVVCDLARYPVFLKLLAVRPVRYLAELDDLEQTRRGARLLDNVDSKTISNPAGISDADFAEAMTDEWDSWLRAAVDAGVVNR
jgi:hypothetical protein